MKIFTLVGALVFFAVAAAHGYRIYSGTEVALDGHALPMTLSFWGAAIATALGAGLLFEARR